ncbi:cardiolipin synthase [Muricauda sp. JGD-17]|uniref:Cardiolipin synthase n=1 Tax=Flagellimonas ochracea TaxID=2696472 RepID=A0A964TBC6_9FLAO|nr:cardiolipin synthase [Allomuricauda ochracea]NAY91738.1 cardiolipin synthase [Allomuricauda ochracea]
MNTFFLILYFVLTLGVIFVIIYYGRRPTKSISWVLAVIVLPFAGPILYYLFGVNRRKFRFFNIREFERRKKISRHSPISGDEFLADFPDDLRKKRLSNLISSNSNATPKKGNAISILNDGEETFDALFKAMEKAEKFIHVQYYILEKGMLLDKMLKLFEKKINEGVTVRIIYDSFGSYYLKGKPKKKFREIGVEMRAMMPLRLGNLLFSLNYRNHRKIVVVDNKIAFTGGVNISDKYIKAEGELGKWKDTHLQIKGPLVNDLHLIFLKDYFYASNKDDFDASDYLSEQTSQGETVAQVVAGGPDSNQPVIMQQYIGMVNQAKSKIYIANPYFMPGQAFLQALKIVVQQGVDVHLLVPNKSDSKAAMYAMFSQFEELLKIGAKIYLRDDFSHSKILIVDEDLVSIGSGNFDNRSFEHNYETNILIYDESCNAMISEEFLKIRKRSNELDYESFKKRPRWKKFLEGFSKFFKPLL